MAKIEHTSVFVPADVAAKTGCFTTLPIRVHARDDLANAATDKFVSDWAKHVGDNREKTTFFSYSPVGNWAALLIPEAKPERIGVLAYLFDLGLIQDDIEEELTVDEADKASKDLSGALNVEDARKLMEGSKSMKLKELVSQCMLECINLDRELGLAMLDTYRQLWLEIAEDHTSEITNNMEEYRLQRMSNGGMRVFWPMIQFGTGIHITPEQHKLCEPIIEHATTALLLANDYFSYEREVWELETGKTQRMVSAVEVLTRTQNMSPEDAKAEIKRMIIEAEQNLLDYVDELYRNDPDMDMELRRWIDCAILGTAGNHYWLSATPRQNAWQSKEATPTKASIKQADITVPEINGAVQPINGAVVKVDGFEPEVDGTKPEVNGIDKETNGTISQPNGIAKENSLDIKQADTNGTSTHPVCQDVHTELSDLALAAPSSYILGMPAKGVRSTFIEALNVWLQVPMKPLQDITTIIDTLHNASLILDDIEDESPLRRGRPATHKIFGKAQSINSATFMFVHATSLVQKNLGPSALPALIEGLEILFRGQSWDLYWRQNLICPSESEYISMIDQKTGGMFLMLLRLMVAESTVPNPSDLPDLVQFTRLLGRFFQIRDDYMNLVEYASQKGFGEDLDEGKFSFPIVHCLEHYPEYRGQILSVFRQRSTSDAQTQNLLSTEVKKYLINCLEDSGALKQTLAYIGTVEQELESEIDKLEKHMGRSNPLLRLCLAKLSMKGRS